MIKSIEINGFRGIRAGSLADLTPLVVLVGPNGSGKSTVLEAAMIVAAAKPGAAVNQCIGRRGNREPRWIFFGDTKSTTMSVVTDDVGRIAVEIRLHRGEALEAIRSLERPQTQPEPVLPLRLVDASVRDSTTPLHDLYTRAVELGYRQNVQDTICQVVSGARGIEILTEKNTPIIHIVFDGYSLPISLVGDGIQRVLRLALELASRASGTVLMEEPEVFQHPGAIRLTAKAIVAGTLRGIQTIITTHSLELVDALLDAASESLELVSLYRLQLEQGALRSHRLPGPEAAFARSEIEDDLR